MPPKKITRAAKLKQKAEEDARKKAEEEAARKKAEEEEESSGGESSDREPSDEDPFSDGYETSDAGDNVLDENKNDRLRELYGSGRGAPVAPGDTPPVAPVAPGDTPPVAPVAPGDTPPVAPVAPGDTPPVAPVAPGDTPPVAPVAPGDTPPVARNSPQKMNGARKNLHVRQKKVANEHPKLVKRCVEAIRRDIKKLLENHPEIKDERAFTQFCCGFVSRNSYDRPSRTSTPKKTKDQLIPVPKSLCEVMKSIFIVRGKSMAMLGRLMSAGLCDFRRALPQIEKLYRAVVDLETARNLFDDDAAKAFAALQTNIIDEIRKCLATDKFIGFRAAIAADDEKEAAATKLGKKRSRDDDATLEECAAKRTEILVVD